MTAWRTAFLVSCWLAASVVSPVRAEERPRSPRVGLLGSVSALGAPDVGAGLALDLGARLELDPHHALGLDAGYGVIVGGRETQDRWWILASYGAHVVLDPALRLELGAGIGLGAVSGYDDLDAFVAAPFDPRWAYQLLPAGSVRAGLWMDADPRVSWFVGAEAGALLDVPGLGLREGSARQLGDLLWLSITVGTALWP